MEYRTAAEKGEGANGGKQGKKAERKKSVRFDQYTAVWRKSAELPLL